MKAQADRATMPSGVLTFLFTDIEGSTRRWESDAESMRVALAVHDGTIRQAVTDHGGDVFKHTGDGVCAVFSSPQPAIDAAIEAQRALKLPVRMGIATGEAETRGNDFFGAVLNRAARVMAAGHGGQILVDGATAELSTLADLSPLGARRLRDIAKIVQIYQVRAPGLCTNFPPPRTDDPVLGNLRPPPGELIGREHELVTLADDLRAHRLITLTGVGGVGKTRLAMEVAKRATPDFPDGAWSIELASVTDPAAVPEAVAAALGISQQGGSSLADSVANALDGRIRLLIFDNCEHVLDAAADLVESILSASSTVRILATSREGLRAADERLWPVPSLEVRNGSDSAAVTLFVERAANVGSSLTDQHDLAVVLDICGRLDGIPLAIELAAARLQSMTVTELRDRIDDRFRLLVGSRRGLERHQTLRHAVQWSYDLLESAEKDLLQGCSVFSGGFDIEAATALGGGDQYATLDLLGSLVRKSLVVADRASRHTRFSMLETIRQFAEEQLVLSRGAEAARTAHARYFAARESDVLGLWDGPQQSSAYDWFTTNFANLRSAFRWAADEADLDAASTIAVFSTALGNWIEQYEPIAWAEEVLTRAKAAGHPRLAQLYAAATQCYALGRVDDAVAYTEAAWRAIQSERYDRVPEWFDAALGAPYIASGRPEESIELCHRIIDRASGRHPLARTSLVMALTSAGMTDEAMAYSDDLPGIADDARNPHVMCFAMLAYGGARRETDPTAAQLALRRGLLIARDNRNRQVESHLAVCLARIVSAAGDMEEAFGLLTQAIHNHYDAGGFSHLNNPLSILAVVLERLDHHECAATVSGFAATPYTRGSLPELNAAIAHLQTELGEQAYEELARAGRNMTNAAMTTYALEQIDRARAALP